MVTPDSQTASPTMTTPKTKKWFKQVWAIRETLLIVLVPIVLLPIPLSASEDLGRETKTAYVMLIMAIYWMTDAIPMAVTALLPIVMLPWLDVMSSRRICSNYIKDASILLFGGMLVALAFEKCGLHKRGALRVLLLVGSKPAMVILGCMTVTGFLSMWLSNTACAAMMTPMATAILQELREHRLRQRQLEKQEQSDVESLNDEAEDCLGQVANDTSAVDMDEKQQTQHQTAQSERLPRQRARDDEKFRKFACALKLSITYASSIGGTATLSGCGPNIVLKGIADQLYGPENGLEFMSWFILAFPIMLVELFLTWLSLILLFLGPKALTAMCRRRRLKRKDFGDDDEEEDTSVKSVIRGEYDKLGKMSFGEAVVLTCFVIVILVWLTKQPGGVPGWLSLYPEHDDGPYITDSIIVTSVGIMLFVLPSELPAYLRPGCCSDNHDRPIAHPAKPMLDWRTVNEQMPWSLILLLGGGFALADACKESGLSEVVGSYLIGFQYLPQSVVALIMVVVATVLTTFTSNVSTTTLLLPITSQLVNTIYIHPLYLMMPVTISASFSYILPVSTAANAIVYATGDITTFEMIKAGLVNCILHVAFLQLSTNTWIYHYFNLGTYPEWAPQPTEVAFNEMIESFNSSSGTNRWPTPNSTTSAFFL